MTQRYRIDVRAQRGPHPQYTYIQHKRVKPGKVQRLLDATALDIAKHEGRGEYKASFEYHIDEPTGYETATIRVGDSKFTVRVTPVYEGR